MERNDRTYRFFDAGRNRARRESPAETAGQAEEAAGESGASEGQPQEAAGESGGGRQEGNPSEDRINYVGGQESSAEETTGSEGTGQPGETTGSEGTGQPGETTGSEETGHPGETAGSEWEGLPGETTGTEGTEESLSQAVPAGEPGSAGTVSPWMIGCGILLAVGIAEAALLYRMKTRMKKQQSARQQERDRLEAEISALRERRNKEQEKQSGTVPQERAVLHVGEVHHIGRRQNQQDSLGTVQTGGGLLAVVADGMGGLSDGDKVSQKVVQTMLGDAARILTGQSNGVLYTMAAHANAEVNQMLGEQKLYQSGSTMIAVLAEERSFQWISVGDSRIYLYRGGSLLQINREHIYGTELLEKAVNHEITFGEAARHSKRKSLTSFLGMGELRHVDGCLRPVEARKGDRILLMSDGIFNTVSEEAIARIVRQYPRAEQAAAMLEEEVLKARNPKQDNFTAVLISYD